MQRNNNRFTPITILISLFFLCFPVGQLNAEKVSEVSPIRSCVAKTGRLSVLFLIDESASLKKTDPDNKRVEALSAAISALGLNTLYKTADSIPYVLQIRLDGFGGKYNSHNESGKWFTLSSDSESDIYSAVEDFRTRNKEQQTDYLDAIDGAEKAFVEHERESESENDSCKVLVFVTDGRLDVDGNNKPGSSEADAEEKLCAAEGVVDRLRSQDVFIAGFGLSGPDANADDFTLMRSLVEGTDCGTEAPYGRFVEAKDADELIQALFSNLTPDPATPEKLTPCATEPTNGSCREFRFKTRPPLTKVIMLVGISAGTDDAEIIQPDGTSTPFITGGQTVDIDTPVVKSEAKYALGSVVTLSVDQAPKPYGEWIVRFRGESASEAFVSSTFFSDVQARIDGQVPIVINRDEPKPIKVTMKELGLEGLDVASSSIGQFDEAPILEATLTFGETSIVAMVKSTNESIGEFEVTFDKNDLKGVPSNGQLTLLPTASVESHKISFSPVVVPVVLKMNGAFPEIVSARAEDIDGDGKSELVVTIKGPRDGLGKAQIVESGSLEVVRAPAGFDGKVVSLTSNDGEIEFAAAQVRELTAEVDPSYMANGKLGFKVSIDLKNAEGKINREIVELEISLTKPFNTTRFFMWFIIMLIGFVVVQGIMLIIATSKLSLVNAIPVFTQTFSAEMNFGADGSVIPKSATFKQLVDISRPLSNELKTGIALSISGVTFRGFRKKALQSLLSGKKIGVYAASGGGETNSINVGRYGSEFVNNVAWAKVGSGLEGEWVATFNRDEVLASIDNGATLRGFVLCILPEDPSDPYGRASYVDNELKMGSIREVAQQMCKSVAIEVGAKVPKTPKTPKTTVVEDTDEIDPFG